MLSSFMNSCSMLTLQLTYNSMLSSLPAAAATAVAQRSQGPWQEGRQAKSNSLVKCNTKEKTVEKRVCSLTELKKCT